ncbi:MAG TPA: hypothetical protein VIX59_08350 [Candidatus Binataceae bacterium]
MAVVPKVCGGKLLGSGAGLLGNAGGLLGSGGGVLGMNGGAGPSVPKLLPANALGTLASTKSVMASQSHR